MLNRQMAAILCSDINVLARESDNVSRFAPCTELHQLVRLGALQAHNLHQNAPRVWKTGAWCM